MAAKNGRLEIRATPAVLRDLGERITAAAEQLMPPRTADPGDMDEIRFGHH